MRTKRAIVLIACLVMLYLSVPGSGYALIALPDIGIDYKTMTVVEASKLTAVGMKDARNGDKIFMRVTEEGLFFFKNLRTNFELAYPPVKLKEKDR